MPNGILLSDDLMFTSRIAGIARDLGLTVQVVRGSPALVELARGEPPCCIIIDLANSGLDLRSLILEMENLTKRPRIVAYGSHIDADLLHSARAAGCDIVLPRSKFVAELPSAIGNWFACSEEPST